MVFLKSNRWLAGLLMLAGCVLVGLGFILTPIWTSVPDARMQELAWLAVMAVGVTLPMAWIFRVRASSIVLAIGAVLLWRHAGTAPVIATLFFAGAALGVGTLCVPAAGNRRWALGLLIGMLILAGFFGWLLPYPIHDRLVYALIMGAIWIIRFPVIRQAVTRSLVAWRGATRRAPCGSLFFAVVFLLGSMALWLPTVQFDDLAGHLAITYQLLELKYYRLDAASQVWAMTPWATDVMQAIVAVLAREEARGAFNALWYGLAAYFLWDIASSLGLPVALRWLIAAAFASQPLVMPLLGGMQVEAALTAITAAAIATALHVKVKGNVRSLMPLVLVCSGLLAIKATQIMIVAPLAVWALAGRRIGKELLAIGKLLPLIFVITGSSYFYAGLITGNPVLPVFNDIFRSPYFGVERFSDSHWHGGMEWMLPWHLTFSTARYMEAYEGAAGFLMLALMGGVLLALSSQRTRAPMLVALIAFLGTFYNIQYLRYIFPMLTVAIPLTVTGFYYAMGGSRIIATVLAALVVLNLCFYPNSFYRLRGDDLIWDVAMLQRSGAQVDAAFAPEKVIANYVRSVGNGGGVLLAENGRPYGAPFAGQALTPIWYDHSFMAAAHEADADPDGAVWQSLLHDLGIGYVVTGSTERPSLAAALEALEAKPVLTLSGLTAWQISRGPGAMIPATLAQTRDYARQYLWPEWLRAWMKK